MMIFLVILHHGHAEVQPKMHNVPHNEQKRFEVQFSCERVFALVQTGK